MTELQLSIRSTRAKKLAAQLAKKQQRTITQVVELALERLMANPDDPPKKELDGKFWERMHQAYATDIDLQKSIDAARKPHEPLDL